MIQTLPGMEARVGSIRSIGAVDRWASAGAVAGVAAIVVAAAVVLAPVAGGARAEGAAMDAPAAVAPEAAQGAAPANAPARGPVTSLPLPRYVSLRAETANARRGPSLNHRVDWAFQRRGWPLQVTAEYGHWRQVRDVEGAGGWVHHSLLSGVRTVLLVGDALVPLHASPGETARIRAYAEPGVVARLELCEAGWCRVTAEGGDGWARQDALWGAD